MPCQRDVCILVELSNPCLPSGLTLAESPVYVESSTSHERLGHLSAKNLGFELMT
jgi:hypothetical protein